MPQKSLLSKLARRIAREARDLRLFGAGSIRHRLHKFVGSPECRLRLGGFGPIAVRTSEPDIASFRRIFGDLEYELPVPAVQAAIRDRYEAIIARGATPVIVDAGAYVGAASIWFKSKFPQSHIIAIEPDPDSCGLLRQNLAGLKQSTIIEAAVGASPGHVRIVPASESWATQVERAKSGTPIVTMDDAFGAVPDGEPFLAKINIEGFEEELFSSGLEWLDRISVLFIEPHDWLLPGRRTSRSFQKALGERDFNLFIVGPHLCYARLQDAPASD